MKNFVALIIGDEIISGRRTDAHFLAVATMLKKRGLRLTRVEYLPDKREELVCVFKRTRAAGEVVFSFGGIGNTPDDHTRQAVAVAFHQDLKIHPKGLAVLKTHFASVDSNRALLVEFPENAKLIPNPFNNVPGFYLNEHYFVPGFPQMAHPMIEWVLENFYKEFFSSPQNTKDTALLLTGAKAYESALLPLMEEIQKKYPTCRLYSLPFVRENQPYHLELGIEGPPKQVDDAIFDILQNIKHLAISYRFRED